MSRVVFAVGCNIYEDSAGYGPLSGAEHDAERVYQRLIEGDVGGYDPARSRLLLSPTTQELIEALGDTLATPIETLTFFFAGHGESANGSMFLCCRDTIAAQVWQHSLPLSQLFGFIAGAQPVQTNIIIDACFSGGLVGDLSAIIKPEVLGAADTPSITLLAMAAMDQTAGETPGGGFGTNALLACIDGDTFVQDHSSGLELTEIAPIVSEHIQEAVAQQPVWWALNRQRRETFCRNPNYQASAESAFEQWNPRAFLDSIAPALASHSSNPFDLVATVDRLTGSLVERSTRMRDAFLTAEVRAVRSAALLEYFSPGTAVESAVQDESANLANTVKFTMERLAGALEAEEFALLGPRGGLSDLYYLPLRISKILGWIGAAYHIDRILGAASPFPRETFERIVDRILANYTGSVSAMSDSQAPYILVGLSALHRLGMMPQGEQLLGLLFNSLVSVRGAVADCEIAADKIPPYLLLRLAGSLNERPRLLARPSELATVLLRLATRFELDDVFDQSMSDLDHLPINAFVASDYTTYAKSYVTEGQNFSFMIGHDIWRVSELEAAWPAEANVEPTSGAVQCAAITASLLFPDRTPWFLLAPSADGHAGG